VSRFKALDVPVHYVEHGDGTPVLVLHGANVDHREMTGALEPVFDGVDGYRRVYPTCRAWDARRRPGP
jgi:pimeloyl-ACP methyl ester carboxylesterase